MCNQMVGVGIGIMVGFEDETGAGLGDWLLEIGVSHLCEFETIDISP